MGAKPSKGTSADKRLKENKGGKKSYAPHPKPSQRRTPKK